MKCIVYKRHFMRGIAAVELALILIFAIPLSSLLFALGQACLTYTVLQKGVHDCARYMAALPAIEMRNLAQGALADSAVRNIVNDAISNAHLGVPTQAMKIAVACDGFSCGGNLPNVVSVSVQLSLNDPLYGLAYIYLSQAGFNFTVSATVRYGG